MAKAASERPLLVGRERDVAALVAEVRRGSRIISLLGPPGIGKTSLALAASAVLAPDVPGGAWFCDLSDAATEDALAFAVSALFEADRGSSLGMRRAGPAGPNVCARVGAELAARSATLLVLDNFEQLCPVAHVVERWLAAAPELSLVVTSRERLAIAGEHVIELLPLACPRASADSGELLASEAVQLFRLRANAAGAAASHDLEAVADIVRQLDGIPLAIELAAARTRLFSPRELSRRLSRGEDLLTAPGTRASRHRTLDAAIDWSWQLLSADEQLALGVCSVFKRSFTVEAAEALIASELRRTGRTAAAAPVELVAALRDKSLLRLDEAGRLSLYQSIAEFAQKRLQEAGEAGVAAVRGQHARHFADLAQAFITIRLLQAAPPDSGFVAEVRHERDNLVAAFDHVSSPPSPALRASRANLATALALLYAIAPDAAERNLLAAFDETPPEEVELCATLRLARQSSLNALGQYDEALRIALEVVDSPGVDVGLRAFACVSAGNQLRADGDVEGSLNYHRRAQALLEGTRFTRLFGMNTACLGRLECDLSHLDAARELNARATKICDAIGDVWLAALGIANVAQLEQEAQNFRRADDLFAQALSRFRSTHELQYEGIYACRRAGLYLEWGKAGLAREWYETALHTLAHLNMPLQLVHVHAGMAVLEASAGKLEEAAVELERARHSAARGAQGVVGISLELLAGAVELFTPSIDAETVTYWRSRQRRLQGSDEPDARAARTNLDTRFALRMLTRRLAALEQSTGPVFRLGDEALWFQIDDGERVDLARRGALRRMLVALCEAHAERPGLALDVEALTRAGWPNERILVEAAATRVRVAIATLRKLGLRDLLLTRDDGYLVDPRARVERESVEVEAER